MRRASHTHTHTPSTGLRHPSFREKGAGKRCSECDTRAPPTHAPPPTYTHTRTHWHMHPALSLSLSLTHTHTHTHRKHTLTRTHEIEPLLYLSQKLTRKHRFSVTHIRVCLKLPTVEQKQCTTSQTTDFSRNKRSIHPPTPPSIPWFESKLHLTLRRY